MGNPDPQAIPQINQKYAHSNLYVSNSETHPWKENLRSRNFLLTPLLLLPMLSMLNTVTVLLRGGNFLKEFFFWILDALVLDWRNGI